MLYIEDAAMTDGSVLRDWERFIACAPIEKAHPHEGSLRWVQMKYTSMGACGLAIDLCSSADLFVCQAAFRLLNALLQGSNRETQDAMFEELNSKRHPGFFRSCNQLLQKASIQITLWTAWQKKSSADSGSAVEGDKVFSSVVCEMLKTLGAHFSMLLRNTSILPLSRGLVPVLTRPAKLLRRFSPSQRLVRSECTALFSSHVYGRACEQGLHSALRADPANTFGEPCMVSVGCVQS
jgi:hypothetical protein